MEIYHLEMKRLLKRRALNRKYECDLIDEYDYTSFGATKIYKKMKDKEVVVAEDVIEEREELRREVD